MSTNSKIEWTVIDAESEDAARAAYNAMTGYPLDFELLGVEDYDEAKHG